MKIFAPNTIDAYKYGHFKMVPEGTDFVYTNCTPRSMRLYSGDSDKVVVLGHQGLLKWYLKDLWDETFFKINKKNAVKRFKRRADSVLGKDVITVEHIEKLHDLGFMPLIVRAIDEGEMVKPQIPTMTIETSEGYGGDFYWLVNFLESALSSGTWKTYVNATIAKDFKRICDKWSEKTCDNDLHIPFQCHDFSFRGLSGIYDCASNGIGHLSSFSGTDSILPIDYIEDYYNTDTDETFIAGSVPATEHYVTTLSIASIIEEFENEPDKLQNVNKMFEDRYGFAPDIKLAAELLYQWRLITGMVPEGIVSVVSDSYDFYGVVEYILPILKDVILTRPSNEMGMSKTVVRPDCYSEDTQILTESGWVYFKDLDEKTKVAQVDNGEYSFVLPDKIIAQEYKGEMRHFKDHHGKVDLLVTPNHRMILDQDGKERIVFAEKMGKKGHHKQKMFRSAKAITHTNGITPFERLKIAFQADGSFITGVSSSIRFSFAKDRKVDRMKELLKDCNLKYSIYDLSDGSKEFNIKVDSTLLSKNFNWVDTSNLCGLWCEGFIDELKHWDSSIRNEGRFKFDTTDKSVIDVVEHVALSAGFGVLVTESEDSRSEKFSNVYTAHILSNNTVGGQSWTNTVLNNYDGMVYCVKVPSGKLIVKRNRCTMVCGNSGDPVKVLTGYKVCEIEEYLDYPAHVDPYDDALGCGFEVMKVGDEYIDLMTEKRYSEVEVKGLVESLWDIFGGTVNDKDFKVLDAHIGAIYGDSITLERAENILERLADKGFASSNVVFGIGSYTYNYSTRDTIGMAYKATYGEVNGEGLDIFKEPKTDSGKKSAKGLMRVLKDDSGEFYVEQGIDKSLLDTGELKVRFKNGELYNETTFEEIRERLNKY